MWLLIEILLYCALITFLTIVIHELGHAVAGTLVGFQVLGIEIGDAHFAEWKWRGKSVKIGIGKTGLALMSYRKRLYQRWQVAVMLLGGVAANALVAGIILARYSASNDLPSIPGMIAGLNAVTALSNLVPFRFRHRGEYLASDGSQLFDLFFHAQANPANWIFEIERSIDRSRRKQCRHCFALTTSAWHAIDNDNLEKANTLLRQAHEALPDGEPFMKAYMQMVTACLYIEENNHEKALYLSNAAADVFTASKARQAAAIARLLNFTALVWENRQGEAFAMLSKMESEQPETMPDWFHDRKDYLHLHLECKSGHAEQAITIMQGWKKRPRSPYWKVATTAMLIDCCSEQDMEDEARKYARRVLLLLPKMIKETRSSSLNASLARWLVPRLTEYEQWFTAAGDSEAAAKATQLAARLRDLSRDASEQKSS